MRQALSLARLPVFLTLVLWLVKLYHHESSDGNGWPSTISGSSSRTSTSAVSLAA
jgi:HD-GYP domain-containing protein (c-di-GMP phosphodiesterase class II)